MAELILLIISLSLLTFFSGIGISFLYSSSNELEIEKQKETFSSSLITLFILKKENIYAALRVGYILSMVAFGLAFTRFVEMSLAQTFHPYFLLVILISITSSLIIFLLTEFFSKTLFRINPERTIRIFALPVLICYFLFNPVAVLLRIIATGITRIFSKKGVKPDEGKNIFAPVDIDRYINPAQQVGEIDNEQEETEIELFKNALDFSKVKVRDCIVPRTELVAIEDTAPIEELKNKFIETGYSKILVFHENTDNIIGYVHSSQMFKNPVEIKSEVNPISYIPETMKVSNLLSLFTQKHKSIAIVVDEFGGTSGMVTTEDILEEIFGEIEDEHDTDDLIIKKVREYEWILSARHEISILNSKYHFGLPEDDEYDTIAGLILNRYENIPKKNSIITIGDFEFKILKVTETRIELVIMKIISF